MEGYLAVGVACFLLGYYTGNRKFRRRISNMLSSLRLEDDDYDYEEDEEDD